MVQCVMCRGIVAPGRRCWRPPADGSMRPNGVVMNAPLLDQDPCLVQAVEQFPVQELVTEFAVEALAIAVLPRAARLDIRGLGADAV